MSYNWPGTVCCTPEPGADPGAPSPQYAQAQTPESESQVVSEQRLAYLSSVIFRSHFVAFLPTWNAAPFTNFLFAFLPACLPIITNYKTNNRSNTVMNSNLLGFFLLCVGAPGSNI